MVCDSLQLDIKVSHVIFLSIAHIVAGITRKKSAYSQKVTTRECNEKRTELIQKLIVKGPKDVLSKTQKAWIEALAGFGIPVEVCYVKLWKGDDVLLQDE
jgi:hypothetical protein